MRTSIFVLSIILSFTSSLNAQNSWRQPKNEKLAALVDRYDDEHLRLQPLFATLVGESKYNDRLYIDFTDSFRSSSKNSYQTFLTELKKLNRESLNDSDKINFDILKWELDINIESMSLEDNVIPFNQFRGVPTQLALLGSGSGSQPFKTIKDYDNWLHRASIFPAWSDSAINYFRKGISKNIVLPEVLVEKMIPQMAAMISSDPTKSTFFGPINKIPNDFSEVEKLRLTDSYKKLITEQLNPSFQKLHDFLKTEYLPKARSTSGYGTLPGGNKMYEFYVRYSTTTNMSAAEIYDLGVSEVARIQKEMEMVKTQTGYKDDLKSFFSYIRSEPKFYPYKTAEEILNYYRDIQPKINPVLNRMFNHTPKTVFEIRQIEAFRAASSAAQYSPGSLSDKRPGIFYVPIIDATKTQTRESLFLHEAIPGHHYQLSLQLENSSLPRFRRHGFNSAFVEGWGLYAESLGKELGMYQDPYQYILALGDEIHRAIRLVVDAGLHSRGWTREQAIKYSLDNEPIEEQRAVSEVERYMAIPGQALAYKIGGLKLQELRNRYTKQLGSVFNLGAFHDAILMDGVLPLSVLETKMDTWATQQKH